MRRLSLLYLALLLLPLSACGGGGDDDADAAAEPSAASAATKAPARAIAVMDNLFSPNQTIVAVGEEVNWDWEGTNPHHVVGTLDGKEFDSGEKTGKNRFTLKFDSPGTFEYRCTVHASMIGKVTIR